MGWLDVAQGQGFVLGLGFSKGPQKVRSIFSAFSGGTLGEFLGYFRGIFGAFLGVFSLLETHQISRIFQKIFFFAILFSPEAQPGWPNVNS